MGTIRNEGEINPIVIKVSEDGNDVLVDLRSHWSCTKAWSDFSGTRDLSGNPIHAPFVEEPPAIEFSIKKGKFMIFAKRELTAQPYRPSIWDTDEPDPDVEPHFYGEIRMDDEIYDQIRRTRVVLE